MFYLHFLIEFISSKKFWRAVKKLEPKFYSYEIFTKIQTK